MNFDLVQLLDHLRVEPKGDNYFSGKNIPGERKSVYGGQIAAQALSAATESVDTDRLAHSMHCHFLRAGNTDFPVEYKVLNTRDGRSYSLRQVTALQDNKPIFLATVSFQIAEEGLEHQQPAPDMVPRELMISEREFWKLIQKERPELSYLRPENFSALDILSNFRQGVLNPEPQLPQQNFWVRANGEIDNPADHRLVIAFQSDLQFMNTALYAQPYSIFHPDVRAASLDHSIWFYGDVVSTQWLYYQMESPVSGGGRGLNHGYFYTEDGKIIAATTQEGFIRVQALP